MSKEPINGEDYAPITQALRAAMDSDGWANSTTYCVKLSADMDTFNALCDDIDALHKSLERKNAGMRDFCERVEQAAQAREDVTLWGVDYTALPLDADGVPIHVGDVMKGEKVGGGFGEPFEVVGYIMSNGELEPMDEHKLPRKRKYLHHHHEPTVEDVLREMLDVWGELPSNATNEAIIAEYAAKLRLAGDAIDRLDAENAKLRELVLDMLRWMPCPAPCGRCERYRYPEGCEFEIRRRELGVEL